MTRRQLPAAYGSRNDQLRRGVRRRTVAIAIVLVLSVTAGAAVAYDNGLLPGSSCEDDAVQLAVVASPDIAPALQKSADQVREQELTSDGNCIDVTVTARQSYKVADELRTADKAPDFQVWVPDSDVWVQSLQYSGSGGTTGVSATGSVATSPIAVAATPSASDDLGWPRKTYSWNELADTFDGKKPVRLGAADPARSATGLLALTKLGAAAPEGSEGEVQVAALAKALVQRVSDDDATVLDTLSRGKADEGGEGDSGRNDALVLSEQAAFAHNSSSTPKPELDLFYPTDGSPELDYPFTVVDEDAVSTEQSRAALRFMTHLGSEQGRTLLAEAGFRTGATTSDEALVTAAGGRSPQPFANTSGSQPSATDVQEALGMWTITVQSARLTIVIDSSASMAEPVPGRGQSRMEVTKATMTQGLTTFTPEDEIGVWQFASALDGTRDYRRLVPTRRLGDRFDGSTQRDRLNSAFSKLSPVPGTATGLYETVLASYKEASESYVSGKFNALVVVTDGANEDADGLSRADLLSRLRDLYDVKHPVPIIAIAVGPNGDREEVEQIADVTRGSGHQVTDPAEIQSVILKAIISAGDKQH